MTRPTPDYSLVREGVPLREWLVRLVADDRAVRDAAGAALHAMQWGVPDVNTDLQEISPIPDIAGQSERFNAAVREAVASEGFDTAEFVRRLCAGRVASSNDWSERVDRIHARKEPVEAAWERIADRLTRKINASQDERERQEAAARLARALCAVTARECRIDEEEFEGASISSQADSMAFVVFNALDRAFLAAPEALQLVLEQPQEAYAAMRALERIGPRGIAFAPDLLARIDRTPGNQYPHVDTEAARALGAVGRNNYGVVTALAQRLDSPHPTVRQAAACALTCMGTDVAGLTDELLAKLRKLPLATDYWAAIPAMASLGRHDAEVRAYVINLAKARPPVWETVDGHQYDRVMGERGVALDALVYFKEYPEECLPVLIDALDSFEEYDPDEMYSGPVGRVARVIERFGPAGAPAAEALAAKLGSPRDDFPRAVLDALKAMGPNIPAALPALERFQRESMELERERTSDEGADGTDASAPTDESAPTGESAPTDGASATDGPSAEDDLVGWLIRRIREHAS